MRQETVSTQDTRDQRHDTRDESRDNEQVTLSYLLSPVSYSPFVEDETPNGHQDEKRKPNRNHETIVLGLFSNENLKKIEKI